MNGMLPLKREDVREWPCHVGKNAGVDESVCAKIVSAIERRTMTPDALTELCAHITADSPCDKLVVDWLTRHPGMTRPLWVEIAGRARFNSLTKKLADTMSVV